MTTRPLIEPEVSRSIGVVRRRQSRLSPAAGHFLEMLLGEWQEAAPIATAGRTPQQSA